MGRQLSGGRRTAAWRMRSALALGGVLAAGALLGGALPQGALPQGALPQGVLPTWIITPAARPALKKLWAQSVAARRERVACLGGVIQADTVRITRAEVLDADYSDSLGASANRSLTTCVPPKWIGTAHSHVRSTDDTAPAPRFSPGDRAVMSAWSDRWARQGAFCVLYSVRGAHCEVYPPHLPERTLPDTR
ncbi:MAG TPA: hypothetical protein VFW66_03405 [Gemmatimonadales bacterium]|nr:hypothetical protein [Gemmatimonadales bacterium]